MIDIKKLKNNKIDNKKFKKAFEYPFQFISISIDNKKLVYNIKKNNYKKSNYVDDRYRIKEIFKIMFNKKLKQEKIDVNKINFPQNIEKVYWYQEGENDISPWLMVGRITYEKTHKYVFYIADADYTGFECMGEMKLYISSSLNKILNYAIPKKINIKIKKELGIK